MKQKICQKTLLNLINNNEMKISDIVYKMDRDNSTIRNILERLIKKGYKIEKIYKKEFVRFYAPDKERNKMERNVLYYKYEEDLLEEKKIEEKDKKNERYTIKNDLEKHKKQILDLLKNGEIAELDIQKVLKWNRHKIKEVAFLINKEEKNDIITIFKRKEICIDKLGRSSAKNKNYWKIKGE